MSSPLIQLRRRVAKAPVGPGIYRWLDKEGNILYVGKAKNLRNRLKSYVTGTPKDLGPWKVRMFQLLHDFDVTITNSELEALMLETNLIKQLRPRYNVLMKDDKNYVYVRIGLQDTYPRVEIVRQMDQNGAKYFGPFLSSSETYRAMDMLQQLFAFRACRESLDAYNKKEKTEQSRAGLRPCLDYQIGQCCGLCAGVVTEDEYRRRIEMVLAFFKGEYGPVLERAQALMQEYAAARKFEQASRVRDAIRIVASMQEKQIASDTSWENADVVGIALLSGKVQVVVLHKRDGKLLADQHFSLMGQTDSVADVLEQFLPQYYQGVADLPETVIVGEEFAGMEVFAEWLSELRGKKVSIVVPERGKKSRLLQLAERNAEQKAKQSEARWEAEERNTKGALTDLAEALHLPAPPARIEGFDISHTGGTETVGSMVVFVQGKPKNDHYRSFTIHSMRSGVVDDYRALREVLRRRLRHLAGGLQAEEKAWAKNGIEFSKARKEEQGAIEAIVQRHPEMPQGAQPYRQFLVARHESEIIGFVRLLQHELGLLELTSLWVEESFRDDRLGQFLARAMLRTVKKGKVYVRIAQELEQYYGIVGFRHVLKAPAALQEAAGQHTLVMVYDTQQHKTDLSLGAAPDLLVIDGGKGQLSTVLGVLKEFDLAIPVIGLAKREEEVFVPGTAAPVLFPKDAPAKFLLMRLRDEAHRFANRHREKRALKHAVQSRLDTIPGIGPDLQRELLRTFGSVDAIRRLPDSELKAVLNDAQIEAIRQVL